MDAVSVSWFVAFSAGLLSFLSPCVLPLVPSYIGFITGLGLEDITRARRTTLVHAVLFVVGFSAIFVLLGAGATLVGQLLHAYKPLIARVGGIMLIALGLWMLGVFKFAFLNQERRVHLGDKPLGYLGTLLVGVAFGAGWTPCLGPILSGILMVAGSEATVGRGVALLAAYSAGLAVPFLLSAVLLERFFGFFQQFRTHLGLVNRIAGALLIVVGTLLLTGWFQIMAAWLVKITPAFLLERL
ncbi:MAG: cytochrome c biogenesis protein CcdA [Phycisphaerae bacterium]|nr:cytochrome c biogenesis protein CcdA [Gemmatimonadaceae bacterium]